MKKICSVLIVTLLSVNVFAVSDSYFINGETGKGTIVKVEETTSSTLKPGNIGYADMVDIQNKIVSLITNYSDITVVTNDSRKSAFTEQKTSNSDLFDDGSSIEIGNLIGAELTISSNVNLVTSENPNYRRYTLNLSVINSKTGALIWSSDTPVKHTLHDLSTGVSLHEQGVSLLEALGVELSEEGKQAVLKVNVNEVNRLATLNKLSNAPTQVEKLYYGYDAVAYGVTNDELNAINNELRMLLIQASTSGNIKDETQTEVAVYNIYKKNLEDVDNFFTENPPYIIVYDTNLNTSIYLDYYNNPAVDITTNIIAYPTEAAEQLLDTFKNGIKTSYSSLVLQRYSDWPSSLDSMWNYYVVMGITDDKGNILSTAEVQLPSCRYDESVNGWNFNQPRGSEKVLFKNLNPDLITDKLVIEILGIYTERNKYTEKKYDLSQFQIMTLEEYNAEHLIKQQRLALKEEKKQAALNVKTNKVKTNIIKTNIKERITESGNIFFNGNGGGPSFSLSFGIKQRTYIGCELGLIFDYYYEEIYGNILGTVGYNINLSHNFALFAEVGLGCTISTFEETYILGLGGSVSVGLDFWVRDFEDYEDFSRAGFTVKGCLMISEHITPMVSIGLKFIINKNGFYYRMHF